MVIGFMITRRPLGRLFQLPIILAAASGILTVSCEKVPLLAPSTASITLTASATALPANGTTTLIAQVLEQAGTPPHSGTHVTFTTTLGTVQPSEAETDLNGRVVVTFLAGTGSGVATVTASSGGAGSSTSTASGTGTTATTDSRTVKIAVGAAAVGKVVVNASPALVPAIGGTSTISAVVLDINGNVLQSVSVAFTTTAGTLSASVATTDQTGTAQTVLSTFSLATVTASIGATATTPPATGTTPATTGLASGSVTVGIATAPTLSITPPSTAPTTGLPASFTFAVTASATNGSAVRDLTVSWGDGQTQDLGAVTGSAVVSHVYVSPGTYPVTATLLDTAGNRVVVSTSVTVIAAASPTIIITPSVPITSTPIVNVSFQIQVTPPVGVGIQDASIDFGDGQSSGLGGLNGTVTVSHPYTKKGVVLVTVTVHDTLGRTTTGSTAINVP